MRELLKIDNEEELIFLSNTLNDYYIEEYINYNKEMKYYYIFGNVYDKHKQIINNSIISICRNISKILGLDIMSIDILFNEDSYYVIDVNHSPGFYLSDIGRTNFLKKIKGM